MTDKELIAAYKEAAEMYKEAYKLARDAAREWEKLYQLKQNPHVIYTPVTEDVRPWTPLFEVTCG